MGNIDARHYVDLGSYPIDCPHSMGYDTLLRDIQNDLELKGCAVIKGFVLAECIEELQQEADRVAAAAHRSFSRTNAYFTQDDPDYPTEHPIRRFYDRSNAFVPADNFGEDSILRAIYEWQPFERFIQAAIAEKRFFRYADPLADVIINVVEPGGGFPWHFDTNNYTVTLSIQNAESGGMFQYCPHVRSAVDENYAGVQAILDGSTDGIESFQFRAGDLQIFKGRYTLHRVSAVQGSRTRYVGIFSYAEQPGMVASPERCQQLYGRVLPIHYAKGGQRLDDLID